MAIVTGPPLANILVRGNAFASSTPDLSKIQYAHPTIFVREATTDASAQLITYKATTGVEFYIDGNVDTPIAGTNQGEYDDNFDRWQLNTSLSAGSHTITARVTINGERYDVPGSMTVYSLDTPTVSYVLPSAQQQVFKPSTTPARVQADDQFDQFKDMIFHLYRYDAAAGEFGAHIGDYVVSRAQCDLGAAGNHVTCDANAASGWPLLDEGSYGIKLTTETFADNGILDTDEQNWKYFAIDTTQPGVNMRVEGVATVKDWLTVSASTYDANGIDSVGFYVTAPNDDDTCTGDGTRLAGWRSGALDDDGRYRAALDVSDIDTHRNGAAKFCVTAISRDKATNESQLDTSSFFIDHTAPVVTLKVTSSSTPSASTPVVLRGTVDSEATLQLFRDGVRIDDFALHMDGAGQWSYQLDAGLEKGNHVLKIVATDPYGNSSSETTSPQSVINLAVSAYVPPKEKSILSSTLTPPKLTETLKSTPSVAQMIASQHRAADITKNSQAEVLGAETSGSNPSTSVIAAGSNGWTFFGVAWYWWLLTSALVIGMGNWMLRHRKISQFA
jgi:hypothetical protein